MIFGSETTGLNLIGHGRSRTLPQPLTGEVVSYPVWWSDRAVPCPPAHMHRIGRTAEPWDAVVYGGNHENVGGSDGGLVV